MTRFFMMTAAATAALSLAACESYAAGHAHKAVKTSAEGYLTDGHDMTLYTFDKDAAGVSNCNGGCAKAWPPLMAEADAKAEGKYSVVTRDDGSKQWAYNGMPLYTWTKDAKAGDTTGDGFKDMWKVAKP